MTNIVMLTKDRQRLTGQAIQTLYQHTAHFTLTVVDDGSRTSPWSAENRGALIVSFGAPIQIVGWLKNTGIQASERYFGRGDWLYLSDNDVAFTPGWLEKMQYTCRTYMPLVLGGYQHPFHGTNFDLHKFHKTDAVAGYSMLMRWSTWDKYGPFDAHAKGVCQSEDFAFCQKITKAGGDVGYIHPPVLAMCGVTNTEGKPAIGHEHFPRIEGLIYE